MTASSVASRQETLFQRQSYDRLKAFKELRPALRKLDALNLDWNRGLTIQTLTPHPYNPTSILWAHNVLEKIPSRLARYDYKPKPDGYGNAGGGLERLIYVPSVGLYLTELEILKLRHPNHPILSDESLPEEIKVILAGGRREFEDETGFVDIDIRTDYPGVFLSDYKYPPWIDVNGKVHPGGHRKITLWGELTSLREGRIVESHEIDETQWFDMSISLPALFFNIAPQRPYWSHVLTTLDGVLSIHRHQKETGNGLVPNIPKRIHPTWWYIHQVGIGDERFPLKGHKPSPSRWYDLFETMVKKRMEEADNDFLYNFFRKDMEKVLREEESGGTVSRAIKDSEDSDGVPTLAEMRKKYEENYIKWYEEEYGVPENMRMPRTA